MNIETFTSELKKLNICVNLYLGEKYVEIL